MSYFYLYMCTHISMEKKGRHQILAIFPFAFIAQ